MTATAPRTETDPALLALLREELVAVSRRGWERGLVAGVSGNNSLRVPGTDLVLIKASGGCMGDMETGDTVLIGLDGTVHDADRVPSKEWRWHVEVYRQRPDVGGIAHLHPPLSVAFTVADRPMPLVTTAARAHLRRVGQVPLLPAGSVELADAVVAEVADPEVRAVLMSEHGAITLGPDLRTAHYRTEYLEDNARVALTASSLLGSGVGALPLAVDTAPLAEANDVVEVTG